MEMRCLDLLLKNNFGVQRRPVRLSTLRTGAKMSPLPFHLTVPGSEQHGFEYWKQGRKDSASKLPILFRNSLALNLLFLGLLAKDVLSLA